MKRIIRRLEPLELAAKRVYTALSRFYATHEVALLYKLRYT